MTPSSFPGRSFEDHRLIASISGGKDSLAMGLFPQEQSHAYEPVFINTGWESARTYEYVRGYLPTILGPITEIRAEIELPDHLEHRLGHYSAMVRLVLKKGMFPSRRRRFCTQHLKVFTMRDHLAGLDADPINAVGIRAEESAERSGLEEWEWNDTYDCYVWRPLIDWTEQQVIDIHHRHGVRPNPHYLRGASRVGCWLCLYARIGEIRAFGEQDPARVQLLADLERVMGDLADKRAREHGFKDAADRGYSRPTWFQSRHGRKTMLCPDCKPWTREGCETCDGKGKVTLSGETKAWPIQEAVQYAMGGGQLEMFAPRPEDQGCMKWGLCDLLRAEER